MRCEFAFMCVQPIKCFALTKKFLLKTIFTKYPEMASEIKANSMSRYLKYLKRPINKELEKDLFIKNKKSHYRQVFFEDKSSKKPS